MRRVGEGGRTASAQIGEQAHHQQRQSIFLIPAEVPEASASRHLPLSLERLFSAALPLPLLFIPVC